MAIQLFMGVTKASFCILLFLLLIPAGSLKESEETQDDFLSQLLDPTSGLLDDNTVRLDSLVIRILVASKYYTFIL